MKRDAGVIALLGGGEWTEPCRALDSRLLHLAERRRGADPAHRRRVRAPGPRRRTGGGVVRGARREGDRAPGVEPARRGGRRARRGHARGPVRLPRRRLAAAPALGAEGKRAVRRVALRARPGRGDRGLGRGRDGRVRPDGRPARRRLHRRPRHGHRRRRVPRPRGRAPTTAASARSSSSPPTPCWWASTSTPRSCASRPATGT